jgi:hypothetical protein
LEKNQDNKKKKKLPANMETVKAFAFINTTITASFLRLCSLLTKKGGYVSDFHENSSYACYEVRCVMLRQMRLNLLLTPSESSSNSPVPHWIIANKIVADIQL